MIVLVVGQGVKHRVMDHVLIIVLLDAHQDVRMVAETHVQGIVKHGAILLVVLPLLHARTAALIIAWEPALSALLTARANVGIIVDKLVGMIIVD